MNRPNNIIGQNLTCLGEGCNISEEYSYNNQELWKTGAYYSVDRAPIDILTNKISSVNKDFKIKYGSENLGEIAINQNSRYFIPLTIGESYIKYDNIKYYLVQFHLHHSSENRINGVISPLEFHFVHESNDGKVLVFSLLINITNNKNKAMPWTKGLFSYENEENIILDLSTLNHLSHETCYLFQGSLTTPPFNINNQWIVFSYLDNKDLLIYKEDFDIFALDYPNNKANDLSPYQKNRYSKPENYLSVYRRDKK